MRLLPQRRRSLVFGVCVLACSIVSASAGIPAGTVLIVRTTKAIDSESAQPGTEFPAGLDQEVAVNGTTLPRGTEAVLRIEQTEQAGRFKGKAALTVRLIAVMVGGQRVAVEAAEATKTSDGKGAKVSAGGIFGAAAGAIAGGAIGGGKGAIIGATTGGAAGVAAMALSGEHVRVPAESRLTFKLTKSLEIP